MGFANTLLGMGCALTLAASPVLAADTSTPANPRANADSPAAGNQSGVGLDRAVADAKDGEWIRLSGTVRSVKDDAFTLDHGKDRITVKMDDFAGDVRQRLTTGARVTVTGRISDHFFTAKNIEASAIRVDSQDEALTADRANVDAMRYVFPEARQSDTGANSSKSSVGAREFQDGEWVSVTGRVVKMSSTGFTIDTGSQTIAVDTRDTRTNGTGDIRIGDRVSIAGAMDDADLFGRHEIAAASVIVLPSTGGGER